MSKVKEKWKAYLDQVPGMPVKIAASAEELTDDSQAMLELHNALPAPLSDRLSSCVEPAEDTPWELLVEHRWCLCEMAEGDYPRVYVFHTLDRLVEGIAKREGQETAVWPMFGMPLGLSKAMQVPGQGNRVVRYLLLPNQKAAIISKTESFEIIDQSLLPANMEMQDEGWLGDPEYMAGKSYYEEGYIESDSFTNDPDMEEGGELETD